MKLRVGITMLGFKKTYTYSFKHNIPNYIPIYLKQTSLIFRWFKYTKRQLFLRLKRQTKLELDEIIPSHINILWINISAPSLGDSLMDLSSRILLKERKVDLFTDKKNADLYRSDKVFRNIYTNQNEVNSSKYDLAIIDSYSTRSVIVKATILPLTPFVGMYGYFNGPEVNRVLFSFHRLNHLLGYINTKNDIQKIAKTSLAISSADKTIIQKEFLPSNYIAIAIGGEWEQRTYNKWNEVVRLLFQKEKNLNIVMVGSLNGKKTSDALLINFRQKNIINCVAKFSFNQTAQIIKQAKLLICCDGGLMHSANSVNTPVVALLCGLSAKMQLTDSIHDFTLFDESNVNNIEEKNIVEKYIEASIYVENYPKVD